MDSLFSAVVSISYENSPGSYLTLGQEQAYDNGLRGAQFFVNVPPEERNPDSLARGSTRIYQYKTNIDLYNSILQNRVEAFSKLHPEVPVFLFDSNKWFNQALDDAIDFGFTNVTGYVARFVGRLVQARQPLIYFSKIDFVHVRTKRAFSGGVSRIEMNSQPSSFTREHTLTFFRRGSPNRAGSQTSRGFHGTISLEYLNRRMEYMTGSIDDMRRYIAYM